MTMKKKSIAQERNGACFSIRAIEEIGVIYKYGALTLVEFSDSSRAILESLPAHKNIVRIKSLSAGTLYVNYKWEYRSHGDFLVKRCSLDNPLLPDGTREGDFFCFLGHDSVGLKLLRERLGLTLSVDKAASLAGSLRHSEKKPVDTTLVGV